mgnify:CR=1 FL=1
MNQEQAMKLVNRAMIGLQRTRTISIEELTRFGWEESTVKSVIADLIPWAIGEKGDALLNALSLVSNRGSVTGQELYNFMTILHRLDKALLIMITGFTETVFPEPDMKWFMELGL